MIKTNDFTDYYTKQHANMIKQFEQWFRCVQKSGRDDVLGDISLHSIMT